MTGKDYFILGCKLLGVYCVFSSVLLFLAISATFGGPHGLLPDLEKTYFLTIYTTRIIPFIYLGMGIYLIKYTNRIHGFVYPTDREISTDFEEKFTLYLKLLGIYLMISYFPDLLRTISAYFALTGPNKVLLSVFMDNQRATFVNAASGVWGVVFGFYLLKDGKFFINLVLKSVSGQESRVNTEEEDAREHSLAKPAVLFLCVFHLSDMQDFFSGTLAKGAGFFIESDGHGWKESSVLKCLL